MSGTAGGKPRMPELGKIKIGGLGASRPTQSGGSFRLPRKDDHFTITTMHRDAAGDFVPDSSLMQELVASGYADPDGRLRRLPIRVISDDIDDVLQAAWVWYAGKTCGGRSDGETVTWFNDPQTGKRLPEPRTEQHDPSVLELADSRGNKLLKLSAVLNVVIASRHARWGGVYRFRTTSRISFDQMYGSLIHISQLTGGVLVGMPLQLTVRPKQVAPQGKSTTVHVVHVELVGGDIGEVQTLAMDRAKFALTFHRQVESLRRQCRALLPAPGEEEPEEIADIAEEFYPSQPAAVPEPAPASYGLIDPNDSMPVETGLVEWPESLDEQVEVETMDSAQADVPVNEPEPPAPDSGDAAVIESGAASWSGFQEAVAFFAGRGGFDPAHTTRQLKIACDCAGSRRSSETKRREILSAMSEGRFDWERCDVAK
jgi:hypothetical protein